tara:strand:+ start:329 stop:532 length:204 start_codon:yes stop_codon:yes gene_type:complete
MSAQVKISTETKSGQETENMPINKRPNIDVLIKKIAKERKQERNTNLIMIFIGLIVISLVSFAFLQF